MFKLALLPVKPGVINWKLVLRSKVTEILVVAEKHMLWTPLVLSLVLASYHSAADSLIFTRFNSSALATTIRVEPDIERAATSGLSSNPAKG